MDGLYHFPTNRLRKLQDPTKTPLVFVACGSFSPVTFLHLRMFEMARDHAKFHTNFEVVGGYMSLVNDAYKKPGLAPARHRYRMCSLACQDPSDWLMVDPWEAREAEYVTTAKVLDHFDQNLNRIGNGVECITTKERKQIRIILLAGSDLILTMSEPGLWAEEDLRHILGCYGCYIIERAESEIDPDSLADPSSHSPSPLAMYRERIYMVPQLVRNDVSSTKVRLFIRKGMSVAYLTPSLVIKYINQHGLYLDEAGGAGGTGGVVTGLSTPNILAAKSPCVKAIPDTEENSFLAPSRLE
ncbi:hypothetical protein BY996DRAFT_4577589 [Phakopsora pachyrhizi]|uniref:Nicotinamide-nucleotide adenylyltransferase n=1 Tax=Phakopsora pachyrhizi TaxID=170000 RepID=A0AAV0B424_PHAPC|nr:hypothetical protein BY996DRAFT_4577589 [Phakopsora pachyrhizi]CAH7677097.1 hypothetical protein PPACK8108_LOCUS12227 [Phakopsora pachyrhizi]CAH7678519.1 hypothetical protein PPACK8108_LOCUS13048 [Phakopsora pachyrhizi]